MAGVEQVLYLMVAALRVVTLGQLASAVVGTSSRSTNPPLDVALALLFAAWSILLLVVGYRRGSIRHRRLVVGDIAVACVVLLGMEFVTDESLRVNTWDAWGGGVTYSCGIYAGIALTTVRGRVIAPLALATCYLLPTGLEASQPSAMLTAWTNALNYPAFTAIGYYVSSYLLRVAAEADEARRDAARSAAEAEASRHRALLHDQATILDLVARGTDDPALSDALRRQAAQEARRVAAFMERSASGRGPAVSEPTDLAAIAAGVSEHFGDLRPVVTVDLAAGTALTPPAATAVQGALTTLLHNVRRHADAEHVVVHADADGSAWELTVRDDGVGFDPDVTAEGYGLRVQAGADCREAGVSVTLESAPGEGTTVVLRGGRDTVHESSPRRRTP